MLYQQLKLTWEPLDVRDSERMGGRLSRILESWRGTPYAVGQGHRGVASDCVRSTVLILAEWMQWEAPDIHTLPPDAGLHTRLEAVRALRAIRRALPPNKRLKSKLVQPGDVLITGHSQGGPGHAIIVGPRRNTLWQATQNSGYEECGWALPPEYAKLYAVLRFVTRSGRF